MTAEERAQLRALWVAAPGLRQLGQQRDGSLVVLRGRLRALLARATPGPWSVDIEQDDDMFSVVIPEIGREMHGSEWAHRRDRERDQCNTFLIVAAVNALPALLDAADRLAEAEALAARGLPLPPPRA